MPTAKEIIDKDGWKAFDTDTLQQLNEEQQAAELAFARKIHRVFKQSDEGREVLEMLVEQMILKSEPSRDDSMYWIGVRDGRADVVRQIMENINLAEADGG